MRNKSTPIDDFSELRLKAEKLLGEKQVKSPDPSTSPDEMMRMIHELEVHQIELEMQQMELVQTKDALEQSLKRSADLYDFAPLGYMTIARNSAILKVNLMATNMLGIERSRLHGRQLSDFILAEDLSAFTAFLDKVFKNDASKCCEVLRLDETAGKTQTRPGAGNVKPLTVCIDAIVSENGDECQLVFSDISRLKEIEHAMLDTNERLQFIMDATFSGTWEWDLETNRQ
ncbi:MAG: PAS domain S-box protein, partial [Chlorobiaceae bacterium]|nr:PAS domain S-box protein [Chlorobiaceae bacterium]